MKSKIVYKGLGSIQEEIDKILEEKQKNKQFKDAGKKVRGSRKERAARLSFITSVDLENLEKDKVVADEMVKKDKVWAPYDWQKDIDDGITSGASYMKHEIRKAFPQKPHENSTQARKIYVGYAELLQDSLNSCVDVNDIENVSKKFVSFKGSDMFFMIDEDVHKDASSEILAKIQSWEIEVMVKKMFGNTFYYLFYQKFYRSKSAKLHWVKALKFEGITSQESEQLVKTWKERVDKDIEIYKERIFEYRQADLKKLKELRYKWKGVSRDYETFRKQATDYYNRRLTELLDKQNTVPEEFKMRDPDWSWTGKKNKPKKTSGPSSEININEGKPLTYIKRTGGLEINSVSEHEIIRLFGFSGVRLGNYVKDIEAQEHIRHFLGASADLFEILNLNAAQTNQAGDLAIAFGAYGRGGKAMATYYPGYKVINLTKKRGDGCVAHEWGHYLDNMLFHSLHLSVITREWFLSSHYQINTHNENPMAIAFFNLMDYIYYGNRNTDSTFTKRFYPGMTDKKSLPYGVRDVKTLDEAMQIIKDTNNTLLKWGYYRDHQKYAIQIFTALVEHLQLPFIDVEFTFARQSNVRSSFYINSANMKSKYWVQPYEMFARAFECYVFDKLKAAGKENNYLVSGNYFDHVTKVYPQGNERKELFRLFDKLIEAIRQTKELNIGEFVPFTTKRTDEYLELDDNSKDEKIQKGIIVGKSKQLQLIELEINYFKIAN